VHSLNAPCAYIKYWPEDGSLQPKHVANYVLMPICVFFFPQSYRASWHYQSFLFTNWCTRELL